MLYSYTLLIGILRGVQLGLHIGNDHLCNTFSATLFRVSNPVIFLRSSTRFGGNTFGIRMTTSYLKMSGHIPSFMHLLMRVNACLATKCAKCLKISAGMSSFVMYFLVFISRKIFSTVFTLIIGISSELKCRI